MREPLPKYDSKTDYRKDFFDIAVKPKYEMVYCMNCTKRFKGSKVHRSCGTCKKSSVYRENYLGEYL